MVYSYQTRVHTLAADAYTPVSVYLRIRDIFPYSLLLESSDYHRKEKAYSYICCMPDAGIRVAQDKIRITLPGGAATETAIGPDTNVTDCLNDFIASYSFQKNEQECCNGKFFGHINYSAVRYFDSLNLTGQGELPGCPDIILNSYRFVLVFDHYHHTLYIVEHYLDEPDDLHRIFLERALQNNHPGTFGFNTQAEEQVYTSDAEFLDMVRKGVEHCLQGDVFQIVLSRRFSLPFSGDDFNVYRALRMVNPSPYLFYFDYGHYKLLGSSPEAQVKRHKGVTQIHPIAGTCQHTGRDEEDRLLKEALLADPKENAEHTMLVDLARNDLSKSHDNVSVTVYKELQQFSHVTHLVSQVAGAASLHNQPFAILAETFPAGTLSGAPKYKAMQLIDAYEGRSRGFYGGCIGYIDPGGDMNMAILIRSFFSCNHKLYYQAGAGIVASSLPEKELQEIDHKLRGLRKAIELAKEI